MQSTPQNGGGGYYASSQQQQQQRPPHSYPGGNMSGPMSGPHMGMSRPYNGGRGGHGSFPQSHHDHNMNNNMSRGPYRNNSNGYSGPPDGGMYGSDGTANRGPFRGGLGQGHMMNNHPSSGTTRYHPANPTSNYDQGNGYTYGSRAHGPTHHTRDLDDFQGGGVPMETMSGMYRGGAPPSHPVEPPRAPPRPLPPVTYVETQDELLEACTALTKCRVISLEPHLSKSAGGEISLLAMAPDDDSCVYVIDVPKIQRVYVYKYLHPVLSDTEITTLVYDIERVGPALIQGLGFSFARLIDLQSLSLAVDWVMYGINRLRGLDTAVENVLQMTAKPNSMLTTEREISEGGLDVWDERPVRDSLREYAAYAVIHYFHLYRALRSKEREAETYSMRIKEHRLNHLNTASGSNDNVFTGLDSANPSSNTVNHEISNETLRELLGEPGVCPLCKHEGHAPTECRKGQPAPMHHLPGPDRFSAPHPQNSGSLHTPYSRGFSGTPTGASNYHHTPPMQHGGNRNNNNNGYDGNNHSGRGGPFPPQAYNSSNQMNHSSYPRENTMQQRSMGGNDRYRAGNRDPSSGGSYPHPQQYANQSYSNPPRGPIAHGNGVNHPHNPLNNLGQQNRAGFVVCEACNKPGHTAETCFQLKPELAQTLTVSCTHCGMPGHREPRCFDKYPHLRNPDGPRAAGFNNNNGSIGSVNNGGPRVYQCSHCGRIGHTVDRCHILYPELRKRTSRVDDTRGVRQQSPGRGREDEYPHSSNGGGIPVDSNEQRNEGPYVSGSRAQGDDETGDPSPKRRYY